ncbi:MAG: hypothetical protein PGN08_11155 [Sphingomonas taxi]
MPPGLALEPTGIVLMMGAGAALLVQWGVIPLLGAEPAAAGAGRAGACRRGASR